MLQERSRTTAIRQLRIALTTSEGIVRARARERQVTRRFRPRAALVAGTRVARPRAGHALRNVAMGMLQERSRGTAIRQLRIALTASEGIVRARARERQVTRRFRPRAALVAGTRVA